MSVSRLCPYLFLIIATPNVHILKNIELSYLVFLKFFIHLETFKIFFEHEASNWPEMYILIFREDRFHTFPYIVCQKTTEIFSHTVSLRFVVRDFKPPSAVAPGPSFSKAVNKHALPQGRIAVDPKPCSWRKLRLPLLAHFSCPQYPLAHLFQGEIWKTKGLKEPPGTECVPPSLRSFQDTSWQCFQQSHAGNTRVMLPGYHFTMTCRLCRFSTMFYIQKTCGAGSTSHSSCWAVGRSVKLIFSFLSSFFFWEGGF